MNAAYEKALGIAMNEGLAVASGLPPFDGVAGFAWNKDAQPVFYWDGTLYMAPDVFDADDLAHLKDDDARAFWLNHEIGHWREGVESGTTGLYNYGLDELDDAGYGNLCVLREYRARLLSEVGNHWHWETRRESRPSAEAIYRVYNPLAVNMAVFECFGFPQGYLFECGLGSSKPKAGGQRLAAHRLRDTSNP